MSKLAHILVVEDNASDALLASEALHHAKVKNDVSIARSASEARTELFGDGKLPDILFIDINLPDGSGLDLVEEIKADMSLNKIPSIILTGSTSERDVIRARNNGVDWYIAKPLTMEKLSQVVADLDSLWWHLVKEEAH